jgi:hypothetical protein
MRKVINKKIQKITRINSDKLELLLISEDFVKQIKNYRQKINIPVNGFNEDDDANKITSLYQNIDKINQIDLAINDILNKYDLPSNFEMSVRLYLLYNKLSWVPSNHSINLRDDYISVKIFKRPTKAEWIVIKKEVDNLIAAINSRKYKFLQRFNYPDGLSALRPKPKLKRTLEILEKSTSLGQKIDINSEEGKEYRYSDADIEAETFPEGKVKQSKKNIGNIRVTRNRYKHYIRGTT